MSVPKLRFKEFKGKWEVKKIEDVTSYVDYRGKTPTKTKEGILLVTAKNIRFGYIDYEISKEYIAEKDYNNVMRRGKPVIGDVLITTEAPLGNIATVDREHIALAQRVIKLRGNKGVMINAFLKYKLLSPGFQNILSTKATGCTAKGIKGSILHKIEIAFPTEREQTKIANFLTTIDEKIAQLTRKYELLARYKKGVMQQLFSQELRFKDESDRDFPDWEDKKINDFLISHKGGAPLTPSDFVKNSAYEVIPKKAISSGGKLSLSLTEGTFCSEIFFKNNLKSVVDDSYLITTLRDLVPSGPSIGYIVKFNSDKSYILAQGVYGIKINNKLDGSFLIHYSNTDMYREMMQTMMVGSTQVHIRNNDFFETPIKTPSLAEQIKIATFLTEIDNKITHIKSQIDIVKRYKQGLLQQMFI